MVKTLAHELESKPMEELLNTIVELLRAGECVDDACIAKLCRAANAGVADVALHVSKKRILPF